MSVNEVLWNSFQHAESKAETKYLILKKFSKTISQNIIIIVIFKYHITKDIISTKDMMHDEVICITVFRKKIYKIKIKST